MGLKIMAKFSSGDQKGIDKLLYLYISVFSTHQDLTNIIYRFLTLIFFSDMSSTYYGWRDEQVHKEFFARGQNHKQRRRP